MEKNTDETEKKKNDSEINYYGVASSLIYVSVIVAIGLPLWWRTTTPSRHELPDISSLLVHSQRIVHHFPISIVTLDDTIEKDELRSQLTRNWPYRVSADGSLAYEYDWRVRQVMDKERDAFEKHSLLKDIDTHIHTIEGHDTRGKLWIFILPEGSSLITGNDPYIFGANRFVYIKNDGEIRTDKSLPEIIVEIVEMTQTYSDNALKSHSIKYMLTPEIDLMIDIIDESDSGTDGNLKSKIDEIHRIGELGFVSQSGVSELININLITQVLHYTIDEGFIEKYLVNSTESTHSNVRLFDIKHVPELMNAVESRIVEHNNKQSHHILLYIPSSESLMFYDPKLKSSSNLIVTPYRGGILVWNKQFDFINGFRALIRDLISLPQSLPKNCIKQNIFFAKWEFDAIMRSVSQMQISKTLSSLESISKLIVKVGNIVILEEISNRMHTAVDLSHSSIDDLSEGNLLNAFKLSTKAYLASETAFFDPTLLSLLYFPEDQKYAIYFPLFLPVSLPLAASMYHLFKIFRKS